MTPDFFFSSAELYIFSSPSLPPSVSLASVVGFICDKGFRDVEPNSAEVGKVSRKPG